MGKSTFQEEEDEVSIHQQIELKFQGQTCKVLHLEYIFCGAETWTLRKVDRKYLESFEMWCWGRMEKIQGTGRVRNKV